MVTSGSLGKMSGCTTMTRAASTLARQGVNIMVISQLASQVMDPNLNLAHWRWVQSSGLVGLSVIHWMSKCCFLKQRGEEKISMLTIAHLRWVAPQDGST